MATRFDMPGSGPMFDESGAFVPLWGSYMTMMNRTIQAVRASGPTAERPTRGVYVGQSWYDTDLGFPVYVNSVSPIVWHDGAGNPV